MTRDELEAAFELIQEKHFVEALQLLRSVIERDDSHWNAWELAGQCYRFLEDYDRAITYLSKAAELRPDTTHILLALGIAYQLNEQFAEAIDTFRCALALDPEYYLAINSLALTQRLSGDLEKAAQNYSQAARAIVRKTVAGMTNSRSNPIVTYKDTMGKLWLEPALHGALYVCARDQDVEGILTPTADEALRYERDERYAGLYWTDLQSTEGKAWRLFLPNYFNTIQETLILSPYMTVISNLGVVHEKLGRHEEARMHFEEAIEFALMKTALLLDRGDLAEAAEAYQFAEELGYSEK